MRYLNAGDIDVGGCIDDYFDDDIDIVVDVGVDNDSHVDI